MFDDRLSGIANRIGTEKILASTLKQNSYLNVSLLKCFPSPAI